MEQTKDIGTTKRFKSLYLFLISFAIAFGITLLLKEPQFTDSQVYVIFLLFFAAGLWVTEAIPAFAVSLLIIAYLVFALGNKYFNSAPENVEMYVHTFADSITWLLLGGFFLGKAMAKTKLDEGLLRFTLKIAGTNPRNLLIGVMSTTMIVSMLLSNTATTTMVLASIMPLVKSFDGKNPGITKALLLGIPVASTAGGIGTIIGTPANAMAVGALEGQGIKLEFLDWMVYGIPIALILTAISCWVLIKTYIKDATPISTSVLDHKKINKSKESSLERNIVVIVILVTIGLWVTTSWHGLKVASVCAIPLVVLTVTGILDGKDIQSLPWDTLLLVAGGLSLGLSLEHSGLLDHYGKMLIALKLDSILLISIFGFLAMIIANVMTNSATSALMIPICMAIVPALKLEVAVIVAISSSAALILLAASPSNAIIFNTGYVKQKDFWLTGILMGLFGPLLAILWVLLMS